MSGHAFKKVSSEYHSTGLPHRGRNCFGRAVPIRKPEPPATITAYLFKVLSSEFLVSGFLFWELPVALLPLCLYAFMPFKSNFNISEKRCFNPFSFGKGVTQRRFCIDRDFELLNTVFNALNNPRWVKISTIMHHPVRVLFLPYAQYPRLRFLLALCSIIQADRRHQVLFPPAFEGRR
jgi:hypothetical protein